MMTVIMNLIESRVFPEIQNRSELVRMAVGHYLEVLQLVDKSVRGVNQTMAELDSLLTRDADISEGVAQQIERLKHNVQTHNAAGRSEFGVRVVYQFAQMVRTMPEGPWRDEYVSKLNDQFGAMIKRADKQAEAVAEPARRKSADKAVELAVKERVERKKSKFSKNKLRKSRGDGDLAERGEMESGYDVMDMLTHWGALMGEEFTELTGNDGVEFL
jgi:hypothetical protein